VFSAHFGLDPEACTNVGEVQNNDEEERAYQFESRRQGRAGESTVKLNDGPGPAENNQKSTQKENRRRKALIRGIKKKAKRTDGF